MVDPRPQVLAARVRPSVPIATNSAERVVGDEEVAAIGALVEIPGRDVELEDTLRGCERRAGIGHVDDPALSSLDQRGSQDMKGLLAGVAEVLQLLGRL